MPAVTIASTGGHGRMSEWFQGVAGGGAVAGLIGLSRFLLGLVRKEGADQVEEQRLNDRDEDARRDIKDLRDDLRTGISEFRAVAAKQADHATQVATLQASQNLVNNMTAKTMDAIATKQEAHGDQLADHASTLRLLTDNVALLRQRIDQVEKERRA